jgi:hypothetical protein
MHLCIATHIGSSLPVPFSDTKYTHIVVQQLPLPISRTFSSSENLILLENSFLWWSSDLDYSRYIIQAKSFICPLSLSHFTQHCCLLTHCVMYQNGWLNNVPFHLGATFYYFIHRYWSGFHLLTLMNNVGLNICVQISIWIFTLCFQFLGVYTSRNVYCESYCKFV